MRAHSNAAPPLFHVNEFGGRGRSVLQSRFQRENRPARDRSHPEWELAPQAPRREEAEGPLSRSEGGSEPALRQEFRLDSGQVSPWELGPEWGSLLVVLPAKLEREAVESRPVLRVAGSREPLEALLREEQPRGQVLWGRSPREEPSRLSGPEW